ncbi:flagellar biosynthesis regulator FlaF [Xinfangfangia sp. CPCC 101601]|uniref:Flagellar biosynthesis regulator FlaF n=1 Tax=Pseudogemmobacter lacusdianii TaxID=3069608 RepID=A0ABU0VUA1_9RHOB|nr:flagellar biosynthesis regulator FlaF [Xinfangfangia sp. CPCC 101601]MDQ2065306.1 flagellar biosynthesis regulator FlaF [Xinfangfangia sp. CPCC 101601]
MTAYPSLAYVSASAPARTARSAEYEVIAQVTRRLAAATQRRTLDYPNFIKALSENERLWSTLAADVADEGNGLPTQLRARLYYLYRFTSDHSRKVRLGNASAEVLVEINTAVLRGLRGTGGGT